LGGREEEGVGGGGRNNGRQGEGIGEWRTPEVNGLNARATGPATRGFEPELLIRPTAAAATTATTTTIQARHLFRVGRGAWGACRVCVRTYFYYYFFGFQTW